MQLQPVNGSHDVKREAGQGNTRGGVAWRYGRASTSASPSLVPLWHGPCQAHKAVPLRPTLSNPKVPGGPQTREGPGSCSSHNQRPGGPSPKRNTGGAGNPGPQRQAPRSPNNREHPSTPTRSASQNLRRKVSLIAEVKPDLHKLKSQKCSEVTAVQRSTRSFARKPCPTVSDVRTTETGGESALQTPPSPSR